MWKDKLNKKERKHLSEQKIRTKFDLKRQYDLIKKCLDEADEKHPRTFVCYECLAIIHKLKDKGVVL